MADGKYSVSFLGSTRLVGGWLDVVTVVVCNVIGLISMSATLSSGLSTGSHPPTVTPVPTSGSRRHITRVNQPTYILNLLVRN